MGVACCAKSQNVKGDPQEQSLVGQQDDALEPSGVQQKLQEINYDTLFLERSQGLRSHNPDVNVFCFTFRLQWTSVDSTNMP